MSFLSEIVSIAHPHTIPFWIYLSRAAAFAQNLSSEALVPFFNSC
jgi:hypothetical protein